MSTDAISDANRSADAPVQPLPLSTRLPVLAFAGALLLLCEFTSPYFSMLGLPISFFLKNKLHLSASGLAQFNLMTAAPLFGGFLFGLVRDRWSPAGRGDGATSWSSVWSWRGSTPPWPWPRPAIRPS